MSEFRERFRSANCSLTFPREFENEINRIVQMHSGERGSIERRPFRRQVDFWMFCIAVALSDQLAPRDGKYQKKMFIQTSQDIISEEFCAFLAIIAVAKFSHDSPEAGEVKHIIELANRLAAAGCPLVIQKFKENIFTSQLDQAVELARTLRNNMLEMQEIGVA